MRMKDAELSTACESLAAIASPYVEVGAPESMAGSYQSLGTETYYRAIQNVCPIAQPFDRIKRCYPLP